MAVSSATPRLQLVWPGKDEFLLSPKDETGKPVWVPRTHPAASEVRLFDWTDSCGQVVDVSPDSDNLLFTGDSLDVLRILAEHPEFQREYRNKVKCVYIDPPFNTGQAFEHYDDWMEHSTWLSFMRDRLFLIKDLLAPDGTVWVHLDNAEVHRMRCLMDEVMGTGTFLAQVVWRRTQGKSSAKRGLGTVCEREGRLAYDGGPHAPGLAVPAGAGCDRRWANLRPDNHRPLGHLGTDERGVPDRGRPAALVTCRWRQVTGSARTGRFPGGGGRSRRLVRRAGPGWPSRRTAAAPARKSPGRSGWSGCVA